MFQGKGGDLVHFVDTVGNPLGLLVAQRILTEINCGPLVLKYVKALRPKNEKKCYSYFY